MASVIAKVGSTGTESSSRVEVERETILYGGRSFDCSSEMAQIFLRRARAVIERGAEQLVPLLHSGGIELLLVSRTTPYSLRDLNDD
ncbi:MAG: hypothetical protein KF742_06285 [Cryobacterium sp.]|nr:hypothetical protein [Cryobacterium sp.]MBX3089139.1 hypothetical protein [Cryobacterium sp.]MBX3117300.1 hypothetical protein [Cryobacterium sp.]MCO5294349.1 hypothetical protein [Homoserinimonas sp.]